MRIWVVEESRPCATCGAVTPHSRRRWAPRLALAVTVLFLGIALSSAVRGLAPAAFAFFAASTLFFVDREARWRVACERCRWKQRWRNRESWPDPRNTIF